MTTRSPVTALVVALAMGLAGCSLNVKSPKFSFSVGLLDRLEGEDAQLEHTGVLGLGVGSVWIGKAERSVQRIPEASDAVIERTDLLNAAGQVIRTQEKTSIGQLADEVEGR